MLKFNNTHVFTGFLKQVLADFNLPKLIGNKWTCVDDPNYYYNKKIRNKTKNLIIKDNIYDTYTHEYLGDYLRFQRDYNNLNLMPLYNCFSNKVCQRLLITPKKLITPIEYSFNFDTNDTNYKIYMLPIKLYKEYTIAIESATPIELCCEIYGEYQPEPETHTTKDNGSIDYNEEIAKITYTKINSINFSQPVVYSKLLNENIDKIDTDTGKYLFDREAKKYLLDHITDLKLFIKVATNVESSIAILEGNYIGYNDSILNIENNTKYSNHFVTNYRPMIAVGKEVDYLENQPFKPIGQLQLLRLNTGISYPFADRLIEYMLGNVINNDEELLDNIKRIQEVVKLNKINYAIGGGDSKEPYKEYQKNINFEFEGTWENRLRPLFYDFIYNEQNGSGGTLNTYDINHDILGYVDKTIEKYYCGIKKDKMGNRIRVDSTGKRVYPSYKDGKEYWPLNSRWVYETLTSIDIYPDMYLDDKERK